MNKGKGSVSEAVAKWLSSSGIDPARLIDTRDTEFNQIQLPTDAMNLSGTLEDTAAAIDIPKEELLTVSVDVGSEANPDTSAQAQVLGMVLRSFVS